MRINPFRYICRKKGRSLVLYLNSNEKNYCQALNNYKEYLRIENQMEKTKAIIRRIDWLDQETREADVCFEVGKNRYWAFCHPCGFTEGEERVVELDFIDCENITWETMFSYNRDEERKLVPMTHDRTSYCCYGKIVGVNPVVVDCGDIHLDLGALTHDDRVVGSYVYFVISRLDVVAV